MHPPHNLKSVSAKMIEPVMKSTTYFQSSYQKQQVKVFNKAFQSDLRSQCKAGHSPAFQSLSFRGNKGYSNNIITKPKCTEPQKDRVKQKTYGAILRIKTATGKEKYALVRGSYTGKWSFPKGHSNEGELPIECTLREVAEETGIDELPEPTEYIQVGYGNYFIFNLDDQVPLIPRDTHEIMDTKWVTLEEMEKMPLNADASLYRKQLKALYVD
jgi:ADP-ribose pyrophosphatase YjhB (NUDIX family)